MTAPTNDALPSFDRFDHDDAYRIGTRLVAQCREQDLPVTISLQLGEQRVFHAALPGSSASNDAWVDRKIRTVRHFADSSLSVYHRYAENGWEQFFFAFALSPQLYAPAGGAVPIWVGGALAGVLGISGLPDQEADHALVADALRYDHAERPAQS